MSSVATNISTMVNDFVNGIVAVLDQIAVSIQQFAPAIAAVVIGVGVVVGVGYAITRTPFLSRLLRWIGL